MKIYLRRIIYISLGLFDRVFRRQTAVSVYCYHSIADDGWFYSVTPKEFSRQLEFLNTHSKLISVADFSDYLLHAKSLPNPVSLITFDDCYLDILSTARKFKQLNYSPLMFAISSPQTVDRADLDTHRPILTKNKFPTDWTVGNHTTSHVDLTKSQNLKSDLKPLPGQKYIAYPWGRYNTNVLTAAKSAGYKLGFTMDSAQITPATDPLAIPRIGVNGTHSFTEFKYLNSPSVILFRRLAKKLKLPII